MIKLSKEQCADDDAERNIDDHLVRNRDSDIFVKNTKRGFAVSPNTIIKPSARSGKSILTPIKLRTNAKPYLRK